MSPTGYISKRQARIEAAKRGIGWRSLDSLIRSGRLPILQAGDRQFVRSCDLEQALLPSVAIPKPAPKQPQQRKRTPRVHRVPGGES